MVNQTKERDHVKFIAIKMEEQLERLADEVVSMRLADVKVDNDFFAKEALKERAIELIQLVTKMLPQEHSCLDEVIEWGVEKGTEAVQDEVPITEALKNTPYYRNVIWRFIAEVSKTEGFTQDQIIELATHLDPILDQAVYGYSRSYVEHNIKIAKRYQDTLLELSVPVVPLFVGVAVLPIIGDIDTNRAQLITDKTIKHCKNLEVERLIIDLSGVTVVDTMVANYLFQLVKTLRLLGIKTLITGIRSAVAITAVSLGVDLQDLNIYTTLQKALDALGYGKIHEESIK